jgi:quinol monooxygenase YgiN
MALHGDARVVTLLVTMTIKPEHDRDFLQLAAETAETVHREEPGTELYAMHEHPDKPNTYVWVERYADEAALEAHGNAPYMADALAKLPGWFAQPPELVKLSQIVPG